MQNEQTVAITEAGVAVNVQSFDAKFTDLVIRLIIIGLFAYLSLTLLAPFAIVVIWAVILAVALYPAFTGLRRLLGGLRPGLARPARPLAAHLPPPSLQRTAHMTITQEQATWFAQTFGQLADNVERAVLGKRHRSRFTDTAGGTSDQGRGSRQLPCH